MTTFKILVKNKRDAVLLFRMLQNISFIDKIEKSEISQVHRTKNQFDRLQKVIKENSSSDLFKSIDDPVKWQRDLRDEWE